METFQPFVYGLYDPAEVGHICYVGMAPSNPNRPYQHAKRARKDLTDCSYLMNWIRSIQREGREPSVMILEQLGTGADRHFCGFVESCYIKSLRSIGHRLTNENDGGWGGSNGPHTLETVAKMKDRWTDERRVTQSRISRERMIGKARSVSSRKKQSETRTGCTLSEENKNGIGRARKIAWENATEEQRAIHAAKISAANTGKKATKEAKINLSAAQKKAWEKRLAEGYVVSEEHRANNAAAQRGKKQSNETKAKRSAALKAAWAAKRLAKFNAQLDAELDSFDPPTELIYEEMWTA